MSNGDNIRASGTGARGGGGKGDGMGEGNMDEPWYVEPSAASGATDGGAGAAAGAVISTSGGGSSSEDGKSCGTSATLGSWSAGADAAADTKTRGRVKSAA